MGKKIWLSPFLGFYGYAVSEFEWLCCFWVLGLVGLKPNFPAV